MIDIKRLRAELRLDPSRDEEVVFLRDEVISLWEQQTLRLWNYRVDHDQSIHNPEPRRVIFLELWPITSITLVEERGKDESIWKEVINDTTIRWVQYGHRGLERLSGTGLDASKTWKENVRATYTGGYSLAPPDIQRALVVQAKFMLERFSSDKVVLKSQAFEKGSTTYESAWLHPYFAALAKKHKGKL